MSATIGRSFTLALFRTVVITKGAAWTDVPARSGDFYITGETLPLSAASYVDRQADKDLLDNLLAGEFYYVLNSRQMGKSSIMVRTAERLRAEGVIGPPSAAKIVGL